VLALRRAALKDPTSAETFRDLASALHPRAEQTSAENVPARLKLATDPKEAERSDP